MAQAAGLDLLAQGLGRRSARRVPGRGIDGPGGVLALVEADDEALRVVAALGPAESASSPACCACAQATWAEPCPWQVSQPTLISAHVVAKRVFRRVVVLAHAGRVALGAHEIPVLVELRPVQDVVVADFFIGIEVEPALSALVLRPAVPGDPQRLQAPVGKFDQILLQGIDAERVFDLEFGGLAVRPVGLDHELAVAPEEARARRRNARTKHRKNRRAPSRRSRGPWRDCGASLPRVLPRPDGTTRRSRCRRMSAEALQRRRRGFRGLKQAMQPPTRA